MNTSRLWLQGKCGVQCNGLVCRQHSDTFCWWALTGWFQLAWTNLWREVDLFVRRSWYESVSCISFAMNSSGQFKSVYRWTAGSIAQHIWNWIYSMWCDGWLCRKLTSHHTIFQNRVEKYLDSWFNTELTRSLLIITGVEHTLHQIRYL